MNEPLERLMADSHPFHALFAKLVPAIGVAPTINGEVCRLVGRIGYRYVNDGERLGDPNADGLVGVAPSLRKLVGRRGLGGVVNTALSELREYRYRPDREYSLALERLTNAAVDYCNMTDDRPNPSYKEDDDDL